jgi:hypothetical protein
MSEDVMLTTAERRGFSYGGPLEVSACGRWLVAWSYHGIRVFDAAEPGPAVWSSYERVLLLRLVEGGLVYATSAPHRLVARGFGAWDEPRAAPLDAAPRALEVDAARARAFVVTGDGALRRFSLSGAALAEEGALAGEQAEAAVLVLSADGRQLALSRGESKARSALVEVLDAQTLGVTHALKGLRGACLHLAFCPDSALIAAATATSAVVWAGPKAKAQSVFKAKRKIRHLWFIDAAHLLITDEEEAAVCVEVASGAERWRHAHHGPATRRGGQVLHARYDKLWLRDGLTGAAVGEAAASGHPRVVTLHPTAEVAYMYTSLGALISTWRLDEPRVAQPAELDGGAITSAALDAAGGWMALGTSSGAVLIHAMPVQGAARVVGALRGKYGSGSCKALLLDAARDRVWGASEEFIVGWRLSTGEQLASWRVSESRGHVLYAPPDEDVLIVATDDYYGEQALRVFSPGEDSPRGVLTPAQRIDALTGAQGVVSCRGHAATQRLQLSPLALDAPVAVPPPPALPLDRIVCDAKRVGIACWLDAARCATLHEDGALRVWDAATGALKATHPTKLPRPERLFVLSARQIVACGADGEAVLCDVV